MSGRLIAIFLVACGVIAGAAMYWLQVHAFYEELNPEAVRIRVTKAGKPVHLKNVSVARAIDSESSPIRFRACFLAADPEVFEGADPAPDAVPLNAPRWFDCFDAARIGSDLEAGRAHAIMGEANIHYGIDRLLAVYPDGRGYAWHQINACGAEVFNGKPPPPGCPSPPTE